MAESKIYLMSWYVDRNSQRDQSFGASSNDFRTASAKILIQIFVAKESGKKLSGSNATSQ